MKVLRANGFSEYYLNGKNLKRTFKKKKNKIHYPFQNTLFLRKGCNLKVVIHIDMNFNSVTHV